MEMTVLIIAILAATIGISFFTDITTRRILNIVTFPAIVTGLAIHSVTAGLEGFIFSGLGFLIGFGLLLIPYIMGGMGAGDVKLMAAVGALMGPGFVISTFLFAAIAGGVMGLYFIAKQRGALENFHTMLYAMPLIRNTAGSLSEIRSGARHASLPYGVAIAVGTVVTFAGSLAGGVLPV
nr:prepilin peptidase [Alkalicoccus halolimnae]